jgi:hypothetical protein
MPRELLQYGAFGFGLQQQREISVGILPQGKKIFVSAARS